MEKRDCHRFNGNKNLKKGGKIILKYVLKYSFNFSSFFHCFDVIGESSDDRNPSPPSTATAQRAGLLASFLSSSSLVDRPLLRGFCAVSEESKVFAIGSSGAVRKASSETSSESS